LLKNRFNLPAGLFWFYLWNKIIFRHILSLYP
jgi:hypothetical protein